MILADGRTSRGGRRRRPIVRVLLVVLLLVLVFLLGVAFGRVLDEQDEPGGLVTTVRTVTPLPRQPPARTVTVTVTEP